MIRIQTIPPAMAGLALTALLLYACGGGGGSGGTATAPTAPTAQLSIGEVPSAVPLASSGTYHGVAVSTGEVREGENAARVLSYLQTHITGGPWQAGPGYIWSHPPGLPTFAAPPVVRIAAGSPADFEQLVRDAVGLVNAALPNDKQITIGAPAPPRVAIEDVPTGEIFFDLTPTGADWNLRPGAVYRPGSEGLAQQDQVEVYDPVDGRREYKSMRAGHVWHSEETPRNVWFSVLLHEFVHTLGLSGHVDQGRFSESLMRDGTLLITTTLPVIDGDALNAAYSRLEPGTEPEELSLQSLGPWADTRFHLQGALAGVEASFGASTRNGVGAAWASGPQPATDLTDNPALMGNVQWNGALIGFTRADETVGGDAAIRVDLATLAGRADFTNLESWDRRAAPGSAGGGIPWLDGDLGYAIAVQGNGFRKTSGDAGTLRGAFVGQQHEGAVGTLERQDLSAAFGGTR